MKFASSTGSFSSQIMQQVGVQLAAFKALSSVVLYSCLDHVHTDVLTSAVGYCLPFRARIRSTGW
jgi:hypothetical protein